MDTKPAIEPLTVTIEGFCSATGVGRTKAYELIARREIEKLVIGGRTLVTYASVKALIERTRAAQTQTDGAAR